MGKAMNRNWRLIYSNWQTSGLSKSAYCRKHNLPINRFRYYASKIENQSSVNSRRARHSTAAQFIEVTCSKSNSPVDDTSPSSLTLRLPCGSSIELPLGFNTDILKEVHK